MKTMLFFPDIYRNIVSLGNLILHWLRHAVGCPYTLSFRYEMRYEIIYSYEIRSKTLQT